MDKRDEPAIFSHGFAGSLAQRGTARAAGSGPARKIYLKGLIVRRFDVARTKKRRTRSAF